MQGRWVLTVAALALGLVACSGSEAPAPGATSTTAPTTVAAPSPTASTTPGPSRTTPAPTPGTNGATPAPTWLGTRILPKAADGFGVRRPTPKELRDRRIITEDLLPPPAGGRFRSTTQRVTEDQARRWTWTPDCPVEVGDLRRVTVAFRGFDGRAHTGELLLDRRVAADVVSVFRTLFADDWPIEQLRITRTADLDAPPTGDGNVTGSFACRAVRGASSWSQHAYGTAVDLNPFLNPYTSGRTLLPELAGAYLDRDRRQPGMNTRNSLPVKAFRAIGWGWSGDYRSKKDYMHFSASGG